MSIKALIKSPQERALENLIWDRLSAFWTQVYDPSDKDALNAMYDAFLKALDAEYVRLYQIDDNKSLYTAPVYTQRRWVRLDLNKYDTLKKWMRFLTGGDPTITIGTSGLIPTTPVVDDKTGVPSGSNANSCGVAATNHTKHWHINFPWRMSNDLAKSVTERRTIELSLPLFQSLTAIWRLDPSGQGSRLAPGIDYLIGDNGKSIRILTAQPSDRYEVEAAFDLSDALFDGLAPCMIAPLGFEIPGTLILPSGFGNGLPIHALILHNPPANSVSPLDGTIVSTMTNAPSYSTTRTFIPYAYGTSDGLAYTSKDRVTLPAGVMLNANDVVLLFGTLQTENVPGHAHIHATRVINSSSGVAEIILSEYAAVPPAFGVVDFFANEFRISTNGKLVAPENLQFDANTGILKFRNLQLPDVNGNVRIDLEYTSESIGTAGSLDAAGHLHYMCAITVATVPEVFDTFDDGGVFDDSVDPIGKFDSRTASNVLTFDVAADLSTLNVYLAGQLQALGTDYTAAIVNPGGTAQLRLFFSSAIKGKTVLLTYRISSQAIQIGGADLIRASGDANVTTGSVSNRYGITQNVLNNLAANFVQLTTAFKSAYGVSDADMQRLIEAAYIASVGGNPVMTLFFDEFPEYAGMPIDAQGLLLSAANTRAIESAGTDFVDIPYLQDHVLSPTVRLFAGVDYTVSRGEIAGSAVLLKKRNENDDVPGQWWVPLLVLDEQFLSRNFGALVGDLRLSSQAYRDALAANFRLRYQGATRGNLHRTVCSYLGSAAFQDDAKVSGYTVETTGYSVTVSNAAGTAQETFDMRKDERLPSVGDPVYPGQSMRGSTVYDQKINGLISYGHSSISVTDDMHLLSPGDTFRAQMTDPVYGTTSWLTLTVDRTDVVTDSAIQYYVVYFTRVTRYLPFNGMRIRVSRDYGAPYASIEGSATAVTPSMQKYLVLSDATRIEVALDAPELFAAGQQVYRGDPLEPSVALVYDDISRPDWYKYTASDFRALMQGRVSFNDGRITTGYISLQLRGTDYALARISPLPPELPRGTLLVVTDSLNGMVRTLEVSGPGTLPGEYYAKTDLTGNQVVTGTVDVRRKPSENDAYLELSPGANAYLPTLTTTGKSRVGTPSLSVSSTTAFPASGRCRITLLDGPASGPGTTLEINYDSKGDFELRNVRWGSLGSVAGEVYAAFSTDVAVGCTITLIGRYATSLINPAFSVLVKERAHHVGQTEAVVVTAENAKDLYDLLKNTSTVIETSVMVRPAPLLAVIAEASPVGSTTVIYSKQVISDFLDVLPADSPAMFQTPSLQITVADPAAAPVTPGNIPEIWLPPNLMSIGLGSALHLGTMTPPPGRLNGPFEYLWTVTEESNVAKQAKTTDLHGPTLRIDLNDPQSVLYVKLKVTDPITKTFCTSVVRVHRFNLPALSVLVTSPTTGTLLPGEVWQIPSPNPVVTLQAVVDPVAPAVIGPYTYSWAVVNLTAPFVAPTITGGTTATPTLSGVANNALLQVTLTVVASGIGGGLTNTFQRVVTIQLV